MSPKVNCPASLAIAAARGFPEPASRSRTFACGIGVLSAFQAVPMMDAEPAASIRSVVAVPAGKAAAEGAIAHADMSTMPAHVACLNVRRTCHLI